MIEANLIVPSFIAGLLTFLAPCTLPLVPGYLGFISGVSLEDLRDPKKAPTIKRRIFLNGVLYVLGFSLVFVVLGTLVGFFGALLGPYRMWLSGIGGALVVFFGLYLMRIIKLPTLGANKSFIPVHLLKPGHPASSFLFGAAFAFGWTPCVGPVLGSILTLAATSATAVQGALLLTVFSFGLAIPFLIIALSIGSVTPYLKNIERYSDKVSIVAGIFLVFIGVLLLTNQLGAWVSYSYILFDFIEYERILDYL